MKCDKCLTEDTTVIRLDEPYHRFCLCKICKFAFDGFEPINEFLKNDFGDFPVKKITKNMINARKKRALGLSGWGSDLEKIANKQKLKELCL